ncbi:SIS domain-containing protein [candidate division KSB1 bacterium]|nr:SIS domain-containing protein [candidate division KSB1 bacterium]
MTSHASVFDEIQWHNSSVPTMLKIRDELPEVKTLILEFAIRSSALKQSLPDILSAYQMIIDCFSEGGTLFISGNGGSFADAMHISGELLKSYLKKRNLPQSDIDKFRSMPFGEELIEGLEVGFPVVVLGLNSSLVSALENDIETRYIAYAQELYALGNPGDVFWGISTSGNAKNVAYAMTTARVIGMSSIGLTGGTGGRFSELADVCLCVPESETFKVQEMHVQIYHLMCAMIEATFFTHHKNH